jgi:hypothetical protein
MWVLVFCTISFQDLPSWMSRIQFLTFSSLKSYVRRYTTSSLQLFFGSYSWGVPISDLSYTFSILLRWPHHFIFCAFVYITVSFINFCNSLFLCPILSYTELVSISSLKCLLETDKLFVSPVQTLSRFHVCRSLHNEDSPCSILINLEVMCPLHAYNRLYLLS